MAPNTTRAAPSSGAEVIPDVEDNSAPEAGEVNGMGLTAEEQAIFDGMRTGEAAPEAGPDGGDGDGAGDGDGDGDGDSDVGDADPALAAGDDQRPPPAAAAEGQQPPATPKPPKTVNYSKYQRELAKATKAADDARAVAQREREDRIRLGARIEMINEALRQQPAAPAAVVDPNAPPENPFDEADIDANVDYAAAVAQLNRRTRYQYESQQTLQTSVTESNEERATKETFDRDARAFMDTEAGQHFPQAYQFLKDARLTEICITKFDKDPEDPTVEFTPAEIQEMVRLFNNEEKWVVSEAIKAKKSPALAIMKLAKARGFKPQAAAAPAAPAVAPAAPVAPAARAPVAPAAPAAPAANLAAQLAALRQAQEDGRSLSDGGGAPPGGLSAELLLGLGDEEFAELIDRMPKHQLDSLMGRVPG